MFNDNRGYSFFTRGGRGNQPIVGEDQNSPSIQTEGETLENSTDDDIDIIVTDIINGDEEDSQGSPEGQSDSDENLEAVSEDNSNLPANDDKDAEADLESSTKGDVETAEEEDIPASAPGQADLSLEMAVPVNGMRPLFCR